MNHRFLPNLSSFKDVIDILYWVNSQRGYMNPSFMSFILIHSFVVSLVFPRHFPSSLPSTWREVCMQYRFKWTNINYLRRLRKCVMTRPGTRWFMIQALEEEKRTAGRGKRRGRWIYRIGITQSLMVIFQIQETNESLKRTSAARPSSSRQVVLINFFPR